MRVLVCGGRDFNDAPFLSQWLTKRFPADAFGERKHITLIEGGARGADSLAGTWSYNVGASRQRFPADWEKHGKRAGYLRNKQMLEEGKPDLVIAFPGGKGTAMMVKLAEEAGVPVERVEYNGN